MMPNLSEKQLAFLFGLTTGVSLYTLAKSCRELILQYAQQPQQAPEPTSSLLSSRRMADLENEFAIPKETLQRITRQMMSEFKKGLEADGHTIKMIPSFVSSLPDGDETGSYLALDLGGSNFRVCEVLLNGEPTTPAAGVRVRQKKYTIGDDLKMGTAEKLFDFLADCVKSFLEDVLKENIEKMKEKKLGFTFSFPVQQTSINHGVLISWTKGFTTKGVEQKDVVGLLQAAFARKKLKIKVSALVNDTVGTLISHAYNDPQTYVGVILGTGTNAAYVEKIENIPKWKGGPVESGMMWGAFDQEHAVIPLTEYDKRVDVASLNPGKQTYEKLISGMYLGEIVRTVLVDLIKGGYIFKKLVLSQSILNERYKFETAYLSRIERDHSKDLSDVKGLLEDILNITHTTLEERAVVKRVCELVGIRAARLSAAGIAAIVTKMNKLDGCTVAIDGSVYEHYPHFANRMRDALRELLGLSAEHIEFALAHDGSGRGAALIAALS